MYNTYYRYKDVASLFLCGGINFIRARKNSRTRPLTKSVVPPENFFAEHLCTLKKFRTLSHAAGRMESSDISRRISVARDHNRGLKKDQTSASIIQLVPFAPFRPTESRVAL